MIIIHFYRLNCALNGSLMSLPAYFFSVRSRASSRLFMNEMNHQKMLLLFFRRLFSHKYPTSFIVICRITREKIAFAIKMLTLCPIKYKYNFFLSFFYPKNFFSFIRKNNKAAPCPVNVKPLLLWKKNSVCLAFLRFSVIWLCLDAWNFFACAIFYFPVEGKKEKKMINKMWFYYLHCIEGIIFVWNLMETSKTYSFSTGTCCALIKKLNEQFDVFHRY